MKLPSPGFLLNALMQVCRRFPGPMLCAAVGVADLFILIEARDDIDALWLTCQLGLPLTVGLVALSESRAWGKALHWGVQILGLAAVALYCYQMDIRSAHFEYRDVPRYLVLLATAHLFTAVAPYLNRLSVRDFWEYNRQLFANIIIGVVFTLILYAGLALAILAVDQLFDLHIDYKIYGKLFVLLAGIFNTTYFLFHFPKNYEFAEADAGYNAVFKNLCKYILIPIVLLYFLILYAYSGKIIATWGLPRGWVSSLVLGFSVAGIFTYLLNFYLPEHDGSAWVRGYRRWFWWVLLPLTALLFAAIAKRIGDYGVTEPRFLVAHLGVWLAAACLYFLFSKHDNIKFIPISLGLFALVFAFGPFNAFKVSERSQIGILQKLLEKNGRWENGRMKQGASAVPKEDEGQIISALRFLERRDALRRMAWLPMPLDSLPKSSGTYDDAGRMAAWAGIGQSGGTRDDRFLDIRASESLPSSVDVRNFSSFRPIRLSDTGSFRKKPADGDLFRLSANRKSLEWHQAKAGEARLVESFDLQPVMRKWAARANGNFLELAQGETVFDLTGRKGSMRIVVTDARVEKTGGGSELQQLNGYLFLNGK